MKPSKSKKAKPAVKAAAAKKAPVEREEPPRKSNLSRAKLAEYRKLLVDRKMELSGNVDQLEHEALKTSRQDASGDLSTMPIHMADLASDNFEQEFTLGLIENEQDELRAIDEALTRLEEGTYGICEACSKVIPAERLKIVPYARLCITCKTKEEAEGETA
ncbi:MAG: TraR/DksA C4-type zinc finger protein [Planctomycetes bacterium]|nr:TraR/DksA C4-type zinc finger protein [Planctomycetota bacterium]